MELGHVHLSTHHLRKLPMESGVRLGASRFQRVTHLRKTPPLCGPTSLFPTPDRVRSLPERPFGRRRHPETSQTSDTGERTRDQSTGRPSCRRQSGRPLPDTDTSTLPTSQKWEFWLSLPSVKFRRVRRVRTTGQVFEPVSRSDSTNGTPLRASSVLCLGFPLIHEVFYSEKTPGKNLPSLPWS